MTNGVIAQIIRVGVRAFNCHEQSGSTEINRRREATKENDND